MAEQEDGGGRKQRSLDLRLIDLRVACIERVVKARLSDNSYITVLDVGKPQTKNGSSEKFKSLNIMKMVNRRVVVACNLGWVNIDGDDTTCKIMCAVDGDKIELLEPPASAELGDRVSLPGLVQKQYSVIKPKYYKKIIPDFRINNLSQAVFKDTPVVIDGKEGFITVKSLTNCQVDHL